MKIFKTPEELFEACNFTATGKADTLKAEAAWSMYVRETANGNPGAFGRAAEVLSRRAGSRKTRVALVDKPDTSFRLDGRLVQAERKTSGGRIDDIKLKYVIYSLSVHNSTGNKDISPRIMRTEDFLSALYEFKAVKEVRHKGVVDGHAIQPSNRKLWAWLEDQLEYDRTWDYFSEDFEK